MNSSPTLAKLAEALCAAHLSIKAASKSAENPFFKSKYADLSSIIDAVKEPLLQQGIVFIQGVGGSDNMVTVETILLHSSGEWISSTLEIPASKHDAQGYGSAITYGRRYGLQAMCGVPTEDDDGNAATSTAPKIIPAPINPHTGVWEALSPDMQIFLQDIANDVHTLLNKGDVAGAIAHIQDQKLDTDDKVALNTLFDSKQRSAMKKYIEQQKGKV